MRKRVRACSGKFIGLHAADVSRRPIIGQTLYLKELDSPSDLRGSVGNRHYGYDSSSSSSAGTAGA